MVTTVTFDQLVDWLVRFDEHLIEQRAYLTELDSAIGDADHGANMSRGLGAVSAKVDVEAPDHIDDLFRTVGMALVSSVGGASGPLYGTFALRFGASAGHVKELDGPGLAAALRAGLDGLVQRGRTEPGDKTMFDALGPAVAAFEAAISENPDVAAAAEAASAAADSGRDATEALIARKGRASYLGERSVGHLDPGATSSALLVQALAEVLAEA
jgi:dihydroxyacetone kinase-like protein